MMGKKTFRCAAAALLAGALAVASLPGCASQQSAQSSQQNGTAQTTAQSSGRQAKDAFDSSKKLTLEVAGVDFQVPEYFQKNSSDSDSDSSTYFAETGEGTTMLQAGDAGGGEFSSGFGLDQVKQYADNYIEGMAEGDTIKDATRSDISEAQIAGFPAYTFTFTGTFNDYDFGFSGKAYVFHNTDTGDYGLISLSGTDKAKYDYTSDFDKIVASAAVPQASSSASSEEKTSEKSSKDQVTPKFKKTMDSYEKFFKKYAAFMKKYQKDPTDMSLLSDYASMMSEYSDMYSSYQDIDTDDLSAADLAYYTKVNARILDILADVM